MDTEHASPRYSDIDLWEPADILDAMIEGARLGILGMKEGEKRIIYVHPDLSFKTKQFHFNLPNALFIFEIEALKI